MGLLFSLLCGSLWRASGAPLRPVREQVALDEGGFLLVQVSLAGHNCTRMAPCSCEAAQPRGPTSLGQQGGCSQALLQLGRSRGLKTISFLALLAFFATAVVQEVAGKGGAQALWGGQGCGAQLEKPGLEKTKPSTGCGGGKGKFGC